MSNTTKGLTKEDCVKIMSGYRTAPVPVPITFASLFKGWLEQRRLKKAARRDAKKGLVRYPSCPGPDPIEQLYKLSARKLLNIEDHANRFEVGADSGETPDCHDFRAEGSITIPD